MRFDHGVTVTVTRTTGDRYGDVTRGDSVQVEGCALSPQSSSSGQRSSSEQNDRRTTVSTDMILRAPLGTEIRATDEVTLPDGTAWQVIGEAAAPVSPFTGWAPGVRVVLNRTTG